MAASMAKHASGITAHNLSLISRYLRQNNTCSAVLRTHNTHGYRNYHKCSIYNASRVVANNNTTAGKSTDSAETDQGHSVADDAGPVPYAITAMRRKMRKLHSLGSDNFSNIDWNREYTNEDIHRTDTEISKFGKIGKTKSSENRPENDFFGIFEDIKVINDQRDHAVATEEPAKKLRKRLNKKHASATFGHILTNQIKPYEGETILELPYGSMRRDQDNIVKSHGRVHAVQREGYLGGNTQSNNISPPGEQQPQETIFDEQYFESSYSPQTNHNPLSKQDVSAHHHTTGSSSSSTGDATNYFDEQYFPDQTLKEQPTQEKPQEPETTHSNFIEEQYFSSDAQTESNPGNKQAGDHERFSDFVQDFSEPQTTDVRSYETNYKVRPLPKGPAPQESGLITEGLKNNNISQKQDQVTDQSSVNVFEEQYFAGGLDESATPTSSACVNEASSNVFDDQYFGGLDAASRTEHSSPNSHKSTAYSTPEVTDSSIKQPTKPKQKSKTEDYTTTFVDQPRKQAEYIKTQDLRSGAIRVEGDTKQQMRSKTKIKPNLDNPETAYDLAMKIRLEKQGKLRPETETYQSPNTHKWGGAVDTKGYRKLKDQVLDIQKVPEEVVVSILKDSILYQTDEFIAIDKPYGLPSHGGPGVHHSVGKLAAALAVRIGTKKLDLIHRLDKETTGVMLLAKTGDMAWRLRQLFMDRAVIKRYWVITKGVPNPSAGIIDIPMVETEVEGRYRMGLLPHKSEQRNLLIKKHQPDIPRKNAITKYNVLDSNNNASLVELEPETGLKHQIRCHLALGLNTPILGDHKYSHYSKMAPQRLHPEMLQRLGLRQALVRYMPMHLHAKALVLPQLGADGRNIFISCRLPRHFQQNMQWLKLKPPQGV